MTVSSYSWWRRQWHPTPVLLPGKSHGWEEPGRLQSMGSQRVRIYICVCISESLLCTLEINTVLFKKKINGLPWWASG